MKNGAHYFTGGNRENARVALHAEVHVVVPRRRREWLSEKPLCRPLLVMHKEIERSKKRERHGVAGSNTKTPIKNKTRHTTT